jgi:oligosaccharide repeat unit polymerase
MKSWASDNGKTLSEAINYIMVNNKFDTGVDTISVPFALHIFLQINYIIPYLFSYLIARRIIFKDKSSLILLLYGYIIGMITCFLNGSRGPLLENILALLIGFAIVYWQKSGKKLFPIKFMLPIVFVSILLLISFFAILPYMGRDNTASNSYDEFTQYIGAQVYNLNYFIEEKNTSSTFWGANTFVSLYSDFNSFFRINLGAFEGRVSSFFITANGHEMGNVFSCFFAFYVDFGLLGVIICSLFMGWFSQFIFDKIKQKNQMISFISVIYLYLAVNLFFCFFGTRFFQNVIQLKSMIKLFWLFVIYVFVTNGKVFVNNDSTIFTSDYKKV